MGNPIVKISRPQDRLIYPRGIPIQAGLHLYTESVPRLCCCLTGMFLLCVPGIYYKVKTAMSLPYLMGIPTRQDFILILNQYLGYAAVWLACSSSVSQVYIIKLRRPWVCLILWGFLHRQDFILILNQYLGATAVWLTCYSSVSQV